MGDVMVDVNHVSIRFIQNQEKVDNLKEYFIKLVTRKLKYDDFWALTDVNFQIERGERLGVLGFNGAGKSTLLKTVAGVLKPTKGTTRCWSISPFPSCWATCSSSPTTP